MIKEPHAWNHERVQQCPFDPVYPVRASPYSPCWPSLNIQDTSLHRSRLLGLGATISPLYGTVSLTIELRTACMTERCHDPCGCKLM